MEEERRLEEIKKKYSMLMEKKLEGKFKKKKKRKN